MSIIQPPIPKIIQFQQNFNITRVIFNVEVASLRVANELQILPELTATIVENSLELGLAS